MKTSITFEQLKTFCATESGLTKFWQPWNENGWTIASDKKIIIRLDSQLKFTRDWKLGDPPESGNVMRPYRKDGDWLPLPNLRPEHYVACELCKGSKQAKCNLGHFHPCELCDAYGMIVPSGRQLAFGNRLLDAIYIHKLSLLLNCQLNLAGDELDPVSIRFDGGIGLLMPMRPPNKRRGYGMP